MTDFDTRLMYGAKHSSRFDDSHNVEPFFVLSIHHLRSSFYLSFDF